MEHLALLVADMQEDYIGNNKKNSCYPAPLLNRINQRVSTAVKQKELIVYIKNKGRRNKEPYVSGFAEGLSVVSEHIVEKEKASIFTNEVFVALLEEKGITQLEIIGIDGNCCVAASAIDAAKRGYFVVYPLNCIGFKNQERFHRTKEKLLQAGIRILEAAEEIDSLL